MKGQAGVTLSIKEFTDVVKLVLVEISLNLTNHIGETLDSEQ